MDEVYDLHQHTHCVLLYIAKNVVYIDTISTLSRSISAFENNPRHINDACITYNDQNEVISWGDKSFEKNNKEHIRIDKFQDRLYHLFEKGENNWDSEDFFFLEAVSSYVQLLVKKYIEDPKKKIKSLNELHYALVVPSEWREEIRDDMIRSIFIKSGLITQNDHKDRLLFYSEIESICYQLKDEDHKNYSFKRGQNTIICRLIPNEKDSALINLDLVTTTNSLFHFPNSIFSPYVSRSNSFFITSENIRSGIRSVLKVKCSSNVDDDTIERMMQYIYFSDLPKMDKYDKEESYNYGTNKQVTFWIAEANEWGLSKDQINFMKSIHPFDICAKISTDLLSNMNDILSNNPMKDYELLALEDQYSSQLKLDSFLLNWLKCISEYIRRFSISRTKKVVSSTEMIKESGILHGAIKGVLQTIKNADMYSKPRIISSTISTSSFLNSKPNAILKIDISLKSTLLSYSILNDSGLPERVLDHNFFTNDIYLPSLESFYNASNIKSLKLKYQPIPLTERYILGDLNYFSMDKYFATKKYIMSKIETMLNKNVPTTTVKMHKPTKRREHVKAYLRTYKSYIKNALKNKEDPVQPKEKALSPIEEELMSIKESLSSTEEALLSTSETLASIKQKMYLQAFLLMYMIYVKYVISNKLAVYLNSNDKKIGYAVTIEKKLLDSLIGTKDNLKDLIYTSGIVQKDDVNKKLRIITQGEGLLPLIQKSLSVQLSLKSFFVLSQLNQDYIQLTLNQVVTEPNLEENEQEAIILQDEIIPIHNIYDSFCLYMWDNVMQNKTLIQLCDRHGKSSNDSIFELFALKTKKEFTNHLREYILENILSKSSNWKITDKNDIKLNNSCTCKVCLTVEDIIDISLKPVLKDIVITVSSVLMNKDIFGNYENVDYLFNLIYFNHNSSFQNYIIKILNEEAHDFNQKQGIETSCLVIPELPHQLLRPTLNQQLFLYKPFQIGTLHQVYSENYSFSIDQEEDFLYKDKLTDTEFITLNKKVALSLIKKGKVITIQSNRNFFVNIQPIRYGWPTIIDYYKFIPETINDNQIISLKDNLSYKAGYCVLRHKLGSFQIGGVIPVNISMIYQGYSSSLQFSSKTVGEVSDQEYLVEMGEPMTLTRI